MSYALQIKSIHQVNSSKFHDSQSTVSAGLYVHKVSTSFKIILQWR